MRSCLIVVLVSVIAVMLGTSMYLTRQQPAHTSTTTTADAPHIGEGRHSPPSERGEELSGAILANRDQRTSAATSIPAATGVAPNLATNAAPPPTPLDQAIETFVSAQASFQQKHQAWKQVQDARQLDQVIEALKKGAASNPTCPGYPAALGQAQLYRAGEISRDGGTISQMGILGMQADQNFDTALKLDPANWEAQFFKAAAMSHWPLELNKGEEVIQRLSRLIDQQDTVSPDPQFAQTYVMLGDQYYKMGQPQHAAATWQIGAQRFPGHAELQQRIRGN